MSRGVLTGAQAAATTDGGQVKADQLPLEQSLNLSFWQPRLTCTQSAVQAGMQEGPSSIIVAYHASPMLVWADTGDCCARRGVHVLCPGGN